MHRTRRILIAGLALLAGWAPAAGSEPRELLDVAAALPPEAGEALLVASQEPELLAEVGRLQARSSRRFDRLLEGLHRRDQEDVWALLAQPELVARLVDTQGEAPRVERVLADYPEPVHEVARTYARHDLELLAAIAAVGAATEAQFEALTAVHPVRVRSALRTLMEHPEAMAALQERRDEVAAVGQRFGDDPDGLRAAVAERRSALTAAPAEDAAASPYAEVAAVYRQRYAVGAPAADDVETTVVYRPYPYPYPYPYAYRPAWAYPHPYLYWYGMPRWYDGYGWHARLDWYVTPRVRASVGIGAPYPRRVYAPARVVAQRPPRGVRVGPSPGPREVWRRRHDGTRTHRGR